MNMREELINRPVFRRQGRFERISRHGVEEIEVDSVMDVPGFDEFFFHPANSFKQDSKDRGATYARGWPNRNIIIQRSGSLPVLIHRPYSPTSPRASRC